MRPEVNPLFGALLGDGWFPSPAHVMRRAAILNAFSEYPPGRLIEMGCGAGRMLADWDGLGHWGRAVEPDQIARNLASRCVDALDLNFEVSASPADGPYDYLVATEVLEHVEDPLAVLTEWLQHLREGGIVVLTVPAFRRLWGKSDEWAGHVRRFEPDEFRRLAEDAGLHVRSARLYGYPIGNLLRVAGNAASALKVRRRGKALGRDEATFASGHDRSIENRMAPLLRSVPGRAALRTGIALQRRFDKGHGLILIARKGGTAE